MSIEAYKWAWKQPVRGVDKLVLLALAEHASEQNGYTAWPSLDRLAAMLVGDGEPTPQRKTVTRALANLEAKELIHRRRTKGGNGRSTRYVLLMKQGHDATGSGTSAPETGTSAPANSDTASHDPLIPKGTATGEQGRSDTVGSTVPVDPDWQCTHEGCEDERHSPKCSIANVMRKSRKGNAA